MLKKKIKIICLILVIFLNLGVCGCMIDNKKITAENMRDNALDYLNTNYDDTFAEKGYSSCNWAYDYSIVTFTSEKYDDAFVEVRAYKNQDGSYTFKDNYFHFYMQNDAELYFTEFLNEINPLTIKVRFPNTIWSDELDGAFSFNEWKAKGKCSIDVYFITQYEIETSIQKEVVNKIAFEKITGLVTFLSTDEINSLKNETLDDILNNQNDFIKSKKDYYINTDFEIDE